MSKENGKRGNPLQTSLFRSGITDYETFLSENQRKINLLLNRFLRLSVLIGPLLMVAIALNIFHSVSYTTCILVTLLVLTLSWVHYAMIRNNRSTARAAIVAFLTMDVLLVLMNSAHIGIYITWFVVPLVSLLFSDFKIYGLASVINYCMMTLSVWLVSPYYAGLRVDFDTPMQYFIERMSGFTIETVIMVAAGYGLCRISTSYYRELIEKYQSLNESRRQIDEQIHISMTDELTQLNNRRCYDADIEVFKEQGKKEGLALFSIDVNGLKEINDARGHAAGDSLLRGAAECLAAAVGTAGKVYRTGGDEFMAITETRTPAALAEEIKKRSGEWSAMNHMELSLSVGYALQAEHPDADIHALEILADQMMYQDKGRYYSRPETDRRGKQITG